MEDPVAPRSPGTDLHRIEMFDGVIPDKSGLHSATLCSSEGFQHILERVPEWCARVIVNSCKMPTTPRALTQN